MAFNSNADFFMSLSLASETVCDGIQEHYPLGEASGTRAGIRSSANDLADVNTVGQTTGKIGDAADFARTNSEHLDAANSGIHNFGDEDFTLAFWVKLTTKTLPAQTIVAKFQHSTGRQYFADYVFGGIDRYRFIVDSDGTGGTEAGVNADNHGSPSTGVFNFIVVWHDSVANTINIQVDDGTPNSTAHSAGIFQGSAIFSIGSSEITAGVPDFFLNGVVDELTVYDRVLTSAEKTALYAAGSGRNLSTCKFFQASVEIDADFNPLLTQENALCDIAIDLRHYYRLEESSGTALDVRGTGDLTGGNPPGNAAGKIGNARNFVRASSHSIAAPNNDLWYMDGTTDFTIVCWASTDDLAAADQAFWGRFDNNPSVDRGPLLFFDANPSDHVRFVMSLDGTTNAINLEPTLSLPVSTLHFFEVTYVASTRLCTFRIERGTTGTHVASATVPAGTWFKTTIPFQIGDSTSAGNLHLDGLVDELTFHDRVLSSAELDGLYNIGSGVNLNDLLFRKVATDFAAEPNFTAALTVFDLAIDFQADADFTMALAVEGDVELALSFQADADFTMPFNFDREMVIDFQADADFALVLESERPIAVSMVALANFQTDPLEVFDAFQVAMEVDADFGQDLNVETDIEIAFTFQADADFVQLLEIDDRALRVDMTAIATFTAVMTVARELVADVEVDADFTMVLDLQVVPLMAVFEADADFQAVFGFANLALSFTFTADADFLSNLFTAEVNGYVNDLLGITDQLENSPRVKVSGIGVNLNPTVLDTQWAAPSLQDDTFLEYLKVDGIIMAESTGATPAPMPNTVHNAYFDEFLGVGKDFFDNLYVLPASIAAGFVITEQNIPMTIYSSFKTDTRSLDSVVNNVDSGVSLGGGFPLLPESLPPQSGFAFTMIISPEGPPVISGTFDFIFDIQTILVPITGDRTIMFALQPETNQAFVERLTFMTEVIRLRDEREQRIQKRKVPRQIFEMEFKLEGLARQILESQLFDRQEKVFGFPVWFEPADLTAPVTAGDLTVNVDDTTFADFRDGGLFAVWENETIFEVQQIASQTATTITAVGQFQVDHPATAKVYPVRLGHMNSTIDGRKSAVNLQMTKIIARVLDNDSDLSDVSAFPSFNGKVLLDEPNMVRGGELDESWAKNFQIIDSDTGTFSVFSNSELSRRGHRKMFFCDSRERLWNVRQLLHGLHGRQTSFYIPTFAKEFTPTLPITSGDDTLTFENFGYTRFVNLRPPRQIIRVVLKDGTKVIRTILSTVILSPEEERIQVDAGWGVDATVDEIDYVDYLTQARFDSDDVQFTHGKSIGEAIVSVPVIEVFE